MNLHISSVLVEYRDKIKSLVKHRSRVTRQVNLSHGTSKNQGQGRQGGVSQSSIHYFICCRLVTKSCLNLL